MRSAGFYAQRMHAYKSQLVRTALDVSRGNQCRASRYLGIHRNTMQRLIRELGIKPQEMRTK